MGVYKVCDRQYGGYQSISPSLCMFIDAAVSFTAVQAGF